MGKGHLDRNAKKNDARLRNIHNLITKATIALVSASDKLHRVTAVTRPLVPQIITVNCVGFFFPGRRRTPVLTMPVAPPHYEAPGYEPPPYHIAISAPVPDPAPSQHAPPLPGYVVQPQDVHAYGKF